MDTTGQGVNELYGSPDISVVAHQRKLEVVPRPSALENPLAVSADHGDRVRRWSIVDILSALSDKRRGGAQVDERGGSYVERAGGESSADELRRPQSGALRKCTLERTSTRASLDSRTRLHDRLSSMRPVVLRMGGSWVRGAAGVPVCGLS